MVRSMTLFTGLTMLAGLVLLGGCETTGKADGKGKKGPPFGSDEDVQRAQSLWSGTLQGYRNWSSPPGLSGWQPGKSPHGKALKYFINSTASRNPNNPGYGSIIVKENYPSEGGDLGAVTIMQKIRGYDPDNADWFWVKYGPDGEVLKNPKGMKLAGRVAKGMNKGCIACHSNARGGDYLFYND